MKTLQDYNYQISIVNELFEIGMINESERVMQLTALRTIADYSLVNFI